MSCPLLFTAIVWVALYLQLRYVQTCGFIATHTDTQSVQFRGGVLSCGLHAASGRIKSNPRSVTSELELAAEICSLMFKRQKPNKNRHSSFGIGLKNVDHPTVNIDWFIESDSSSVRRLQNRKNRNALLILFRPFLLFHFMLFCQNVATIMTGREELKRLISSSQPITVPGNVN